MRGLLADHNCEGHVQALARIFVSKTWHSVWQDLNLNMKTLASVGLSQRAPDIEIWQLCQTRELVLITRNRNGQGADSLEAVINRLNQPKSLPVVTLANADRILRIKSYAERTAERLLEYLIDMEKYCGTGRLFVP